MFHDYLTAKDNARSEHLNDQISLFRLSTDTVPLPHAMQTDGGQCGAATDQSIG